MRNHIEISNTLSPSGSHQYRLYYLSSCLFCLRLPLFTLLLEHYNRWDLMSRGRRPSCSQACISIRASLPSGPKWTRPVPSGPLGGTGAFPIFRPALPGTVGKEGGGIPLIPFEGVQWRGKSEERMQMPMWVVKKNYFSLEIWCLLKNENNSKYLSYWSF